MPKVSIVLPVYNEQKYLELAIRSIAEQSYKDYEFLITQNGSTDQSPEIIARWAKPVSYTHLTLPTNREV